MDKIVNKQSYERAIKWLIQSIDAHDGNGSAAYYQPLIGWAPAYPETTGYIIPTLITAGSILQSDRSTQRALSCADWLCSIQRADGHFPGGVGGILPPNVFDTGQILFGLTKAYEYFGCDHYYEALSKAVRCLFDSSKSTSGWIKEGYIEGYLPVYYTRVIWAILEADKVVQFPGLKEEMIRMLNFFADQIRDNLSFDNWNFSPGETAYTHTIAYTIRGFLESGILLDQSKFIRLAESIAGKLIELIKERGKMAGSYDPDWTGDYSFICVPGHFQMVIVLNRLFQLKGESDFAYWAKKLFARAQRTQGQIPVVGISGGIPGSYPVWGRYQRFKWLNWGAKFYLDAAQSF